MTGRGSWWGSRCCCSSPGASVDLASVAAAVERATGVAMYSIVNVAQLLTYITLKVLRPNPIVACLQALGQGCSRRE